MQHYFDIVEASAAKEYWNIKPIPCTDRKIVVLAPSTRTRSAVLPTLIKPVFLSCLKDDFAG
jgi:hypothetical protein